MLFNSYIFIFAFLPAAIFLLRYLSVFINKNVILTALSLVFYSWWNINNLIVIAISILVNYIFSRAILYYNQIKNNDISFFILIISLCTNIMYIMYYKYFIFLLSIIDEKSFGFLEQAIPLGISFFTFTQIAYLVDSYRGKANEKDFIRYILFVTWFPHLLSGPLLHHAEMMPQFKQGQASRQFDTQFVAGLVVFVLGLAKKILLADSIGSYVWPSNALSPFLKAAQGIDIPFFEAWSAALCYTCQLYFDFSAYSDMAAGCSAMFGVKLPSNFYSPYKARNIVEFWRRWHMTLSRFLRDYVYIPLGGNRTHRLLNVWLTMVVGGIWHGAGWTFILWGALHGCYIVAYRLWQRFSVHPALSLLSNRTPAKALSVALTFLCVVIGWVIFRADTLAAAGNLLAGMAGLNGFALSLEDQKWFGAGGQVLSMLGISFEARVTQPVGPMLLWSGMLLAIAFCLPNTQQIMARFPIWLDMKGYPTPTPASPFFLFNLGRRWATLVGILLLLSLLGLGRPAQFLYFQF